jgi:hypothetical protein
MDTDDWALVRMVELRRAGEAARFRVCWMQRGNGRYYWLEIRRADGTIERCPPRREPPTLGAVARSTEGLPPEGSVEETSSDSNEPV